jgi:magnesium transporter
MRAQAENVSRVHSIYVVDDENRLKGRVVFKDLLTTSTKTQIADIYIKKVTFVNVDAEDVEVAYHAKNTIRSHSSSRCHG